MNIRYFKTWLMLYFPQYFPRFHLISVFWKSCCIYRYTKMYTGQTNVFTYVKKYWNFKIVTNKLYIFLNFKPRNRKYHQLSTWNVPKVNFPKKIYYTNVTNATKFSNQKMVTDCIWRIATVTGKILLFILIVTQKQNHLNATFV